MTCNLLGSAVVLVIFLCFTNLSQCCHWLVSPVKLFTKKKKNKYKTSIMKEEQANGEIL